jgi:beta-lactamase superfamily II metal-dependent hydrolase
MKRILVIFLLIRVYEGAAQTAAPSIADASPIAKVGEPLPAWQEGYLDLHHINTGRGNSAFYILPDGTTVLFDAGELDPSDPRTTSKRNTPIRPNDSHRPYEWIARYIRRVAPSGGKPGIDYAVISHFHDDHFGSWYPSAPLSADGKFALTGIAGVGELLPIHELLTRDYHYPVDPSTQLRRLPAADRFVRNWDNYLAFVKDEQAHGMAVQYMKAGSRSQIRLLHHSAAFPAFYVQNVKSNGWIWTGRDSSVEQHFPPIDTADRKTWPDENPLSNVLVIHYGPFSYYTGGDCPGNVFLGDAPWRDVETPVARAVGEVDIATMDHHGNRDAVSEFLVKTLRPRVWIEQVWTADHPGHEVLIRTMSSYLYPGPRDLFATNMMEANELVIGPLVEQSYKSRQGHIVVRVLPGGASYYVIILDDSREDAVVRQVFGPYMSKGK